MGIFADTSYEDLSAFHEGEMTRGGMSCTYGTLGVLIFADTSHEDFPRFMRETGKSEGRAVRLSIRNHLLLCI